LCSSISRSVQIVGDQRPRGTVQNCRLFMIVVTSPVRCCQCWKSVEVVLTMVLIMMSMMVFLTVFTVVSEDAICFVGVSLVRFACTYDLCLSVAGV
jgi:hypothetical protein